ncbi:MAG: hypothetical protein E7190_03880 [Erysipelotrichaceae bacterium]|nr:hypothetical protein [Erysipelotrichaceae bacterium]
MNLPMIVLIFLIFYMIYSNIGLGKRAQKSRDLNRVLQNFNDKEQLFSDLKEVIESERDPVYVCKYKIIQMWAAAYHGEDEIFHDTLHSLDIQPLLTNGKKNTIGEHEDSFFYLCMATPNRLYYAERMDLMDEYYAEISKYDEIFEPYLFHELGKALKKYYYKQEDLGRSMYEKMDSGDYGEFRYSKQLIGIYKNISSTMMAGIALQQNDEELFEEQVPWLKSFSSSNLGQRWLKEVGIVLPEDEEEETEDEFAEEESEADTDPDNEEEVTEETEKKENGEAE